MGHPLCCFSTLISGVKARRAFATPWWLQQHCDTHTWGVTLTCQVSRHVAPVVILAPTRGSLHANFDKYEKHFAKMYRDVGMAVPKTTQTRYMDGSVQATQMTTQVTPSLHHFSFLSSTQSSFQYSDNKA